MPRERDEGGRALQSRIDPASMNLKNQFLHCRPNASYHDQDGNNRNRGTFDSSLETTLQELSFLCAELR